MSIGSFDGAKICELIGCLLLHSLSNIIDPSYHSLYGDDVLIIGDNCIPRKGDVIRKKLYWLINKFDFKLDIQNNFKITEFSDITFSLYNNTIFSFRKKKKLTTMLF